MMGISISISMLVLVPCILSCYFNYRLGFMIAILIFCV